MKSLKQHGIMNNVQPETDIDIKKAFQEALDDLQEPKAFANRLRKHEVTILVDYKKRQIKGEIVDFKKPFEILRKVPWFREYDYDMR